MRTVESNRKRVGSTLCVRAVGLVLLTAANGFGQAPFRVLEPNGGDSYEVGGTMTIRWSGGSPLGNVTILLSYTVIFSAASFQARRSLRAPLTEGGTVLVGRSLFDHVPNGALITPALTKR
jgi:hypothetical protein